MNNTITFKEWLREENAQGEVGTDKLTRTWTKMTPHMPLVVNEPLKDFEIEIEKRINK